MASVASYDTGAAQLGTLLQAVRAQIYQLSNQRWSDATGAGYEGIYNALPNQGDVPVGGLGITKNQMNNYISGVNSVLSAIDSAMGAIADVAEFDPELLNNS